MPHWPDHRFAGGRILEMRTLGSVLAIAAVLLAGCQQGTQRPDDFPLRQPVASPSSERDFVIGLVGTMSGPGSWRGDDAFEGANLAEQALNRNIEEGRPHYDLVTMDDKGDPTRSTQLVQALAASDRTVGIVYAGPPQGLPPAERALDQAGIPGVLCYGDLFSSRLLRSHTFQVSPPLVWQASAIARYLTHDRGYTSVGLIHEASLMGKAARSSLVATLRGTAAAHPADAAFTHGHLDVRTPLRTMRKKRVEAIVVEGTEAVFAQVVADLRELSSTYTTTKEAKAIRGKHRRHAGWRPQVIGFDLTMNADHRASDWPAGTAVAESYARGVHYLPVPSFKAFSSSFKEWWDSEPLGWQVRAYDAVSMIGWAARRTPVDGDVAATLEGLKRTRFGALDVSFSPDDHVAVEEVSVGLWVLPRAGIEVPERNGLPRELPFVPLQRSFSAIGGRTTVLPADWRYLFFGGARGRPPKFSSARFGVTTPRADPVH